MASERRIYRCWCGSEDFERSEDGVATCKRCGSRFSASSGISKFKILTETDNRDFLKKVWIRLACLDVPDDVFESDFYTMGEIEYEVMTDSVKVSMPFSVTVGYDREEAYWTTETRQVQEYDPSTKSYRWVTKTENVMRYRTVTDWKPYSSVHEASSSVCLQNGDEVFSSRDFLGDAEGGFGLGFEEEKADPNLIWFDEDVFWDALYKAGVGAVAAPNEYECERMRADPFADARAKAVHDEVCERSLMASIPGDHYRNLSYSVNVDEGCTNLFLVPEYYATISYREEDFTVEALPFGNIPMKGGEIENKEGLKAYRDGKIREFKEKAKGIGEIHSKAKWDYSKSFFVAALVMLAVTFAGMLAVAIAAMVLGGGNSNATLLALGIVFFSFFVIAAVVCIAFAVTVTRKEKEIDSKERSDVAEMERLANSEIERNFESHMKEKMDLLNEKLEKLHLEKAEAGDMRDMGLLALPYDELVDGGTKARNAYDKKIRAMKISNGVLFALGIVAAILVIAFVFV